MAISEMEKNLAKLLLYSGIEVRNAIVVGLMLQ